MRRRKDDNAAIEARLAFAELLEKAIPANTRGSLALETWESREAMSKIQTFLSSVITCAVKRDPKSEFCKGWAKVKDPLTGRARNITPEELKHTLTAILSDVEGKDLNIGLGGTF